MRLTRNLGMLLLGIWLIAMGLISIFRISFAGADTVMALLAVAAGVMLLLKR